MTSAVYDAVLRQLQQHDTAAAAVVEAVAVMLMNTGGVAVSMQCSSQPAVCTMWLVVMVYVIVVLCTSEF
jgi:hypothetical protein